MQYEEIIRRVQERGRIADPSKTELVIKAVLGTFGELVYRTEERQMAAQLPKQLRDVFYEYQPRERGRADLGNYPLEEFFNRVKARASVTLQDAERLSHVVLSVLQEAVSPGEIDDVRTELPTRFQTLLHTSSQTAARAAIAEATVVPKPNEYHVMPAKDGKWLVRRGENGKILGTFNSKEMALTEADGIADRIRGDVLVIYNSDGSISKREAPSREFTNTRA